MTNSSKLLSGAAALFLAVAALSPAQAGSVDMNFSVEVAGTRIMKAAYSTQINGDQYQSELSGKTTGMSDMFSAYKLNMAADGTYSGGQFQPGSFENNRKKKNKGAKTTGIIWSAGGVSMHSSKGPVELAPTVTSALNGPSSDPLTAILRMANAQAAKPCSGTYRVYDGKDVYDLGLAFSKQLTLASATSGGGKALECRLTSTPVAGRDVEKGETAPTSYGLVLAPFKTAGAEKPLFLPVRITGKQKGLTVVVKAHGIRVDGTEVDVNLQD